MLSAVEYSRDPDFALAMRIASAALRAVDGIDRERGRFYYDLICASAPASRKEAIEAIMKTLGYEFKSGFLRRYVAEGLAESRKEARQEGRKEGRVELILKQMTARFGPLPEEIQTRVRGAQDAELDTVAERILTARTLDQVLDSNLR